MKARILDNLGQSKYRVELLRDESQQAYVIAHQDAVISILQNEKIPEAEQSVAEAQSEVDSALSAYEAAQADYIATSQLPDDTEGRQALLDAAAQALNQSLVEIAAAGERKRLADLELATLQAELIAAKEQKKLIDQSVEPITIECWTSVWNDSLQPDDEVEVVLIPGEPQKFVIHDAGITNDRLTPIMWQTPAQALFNYMMLPGWQRWQPTFRAADVLGDRHGIAFNTGLLRNSQENSYYQLDRETITPDHLQVISESSSGQDLDVTPVNSEAPVVVAYGNLKRDAFIGGDVALVQYAHLVPKVVGFFEKPRDQVRAGGFDWSNPAVPDEVVSWGHETNGSRYYASLRNDGLYSRMVFMHGRPIAQVPTGELVIGAGIAKFPGTRAMTIVTASVGDGIRFTQCKVFSVPESDWLDLQAEPLLVAQFSVGIEAISTPIAAFSPNGKKFGLVASATGSEPAANIIRGVVAATGVSVSITNGVTASGSTGRSRSGLRWDINGLNGYFEFGVGQTITESYSVTVPIAIDYGASGNEILVEAELEETSTFSTTTNVRKVQGVSDWIEESVYVLLDAHTEGNINQKRSANFPEPITLTSYNETYETHRHFEIWDELRWQLLDLGGFLTDDRELKTRADFESDTAWDTYQSDLAEIEAAIEDETDRLKDLQDTRSSGGGEYKYKFSTPDVADLRTGLQEVYSFKETSRSITGDRSFEFKYQPMSGNIGYINYGRPGEKYMSHFVAKTYVNTSSYDSYSEEVNFHSPWRNIPIYGYSDESTDSNDEFDSWLFFSHDDAVPLSDSSSSDETNSRVSDLITNALMTGAWNSDFICSRSGFFFRDGSAQTDKGVVDAPDGPPMGFY